MRIQMAISISPVKMAERVTKWYTVVADEHIKPIVVLPSGKIRDALKSEWDSFDDWRPCAK